MGETGLFALRETLEKAAFKVHLYKPYLFCSFFSVPFFPLRIVGERSVRRFISFTFGTSSESLLVSTDDQKICACVL